MEVNRIERIDYDMAADFVAKHHYRKTMPKLNKICYGGFIDKRLVAVITFGWGTQPIATIKKMFPSLTTKDYLEIGRLCLLDELPRNSESHFISRVITMLKKNKELKLIFSWSDGIMGKPGYVYQSCNFEYAGKIKTDVYFTQEGYLIHPRSAKSILAINALKENKSKMFWLSNSFCKDNGIIRIKGYQFRYVYFLCGHKMEKSLRKESLVEISNNYPKHKDIEFFSFDGEKYIRCEFPKYKETLSAEEVSRAIHVFSKDKGLVQFQHSAPARQGFLF